MLKWSPFPLSFACHNTANIMAMSQMWFCFLPLPDHICCCTEMPLCGCSSPDVVRNCSFVCTLYQSDLVRGWEIWFSVEKTWQPRHTDTFYLSSHDMFIRLDERVKRCSQHKQEFWHEGKCTSVFKQYPISLHLSSKKVAGAQRIATYYFLYKVKGTHNIQLMFDSS